MNTSPWCCITGAHTISSLHTCTGIALYTCSSSECMYIVHIVPSRAETTQKHFGYNNNIGHLLVYTKILNMLKNNYNTNCQGNTQSEFVQENGHVVLAHLKAKSPILPSHQTVMGLGTVWYLKAHLKQKKKQMEGRCNDAMQRKQEEIVSVQISEQGLNIQLQKLHFLLHHGCHDNRIIFLVNFLERKKNKIHT